MCLLVFAWMKHPRYRLVVAANRDEFHDRPAAPLGWWTGNDRMLAGRDLRAGGTWIGVTRSGRFGAVTNFRGVEAPPVADAPSRGGLVPDYLAGEATPGGFLEKVNGAATTFAGFNLLAGDLESLHYLSNRDAASPRRLEPGIYGLSNHALDTPWPRLVRARGRFDDVLAGGEPGLDELFEILADREPATDANTAWIGPASGNGTRDVCAIRAARALWDALLYGASRWTRRSHGGGQREGSTPPET